MINNGRFGVLSVSVVLLIAAGLVVAGCAQAPLPLPAVDAGTTLVSAPTVVLPSVAENVAALGTVVLPGFADWKTLDDPAAGYSIRYPLDAYLSTGKNQAGVYTTRVQFLVPGAEGYQGMLIRVEPNPKGTGSEQVVSELYQRFMGGTPPVDLVNGIGDVTVDGLPAVQMGGGGDFAIVVPYADRVYIIAPVHGQAATALDPQALALFYQIISTLRVRR